MKKKIIVIVSIIVVLILAVGGAYLIDKNRMDNNKPVIFSTWGYQYAPPEVLGEIVKIIDRTVTENLSCDTAFEKFYEDAENEYYFNCIKSDYIIVEYANGYKEDIKAALESGKATLADLKRFNIGYDTKEKETGNIEKNNTITIKYKSSDNINRLFEFIENTKVDSLNRIEDEIRVITYTIEGDPIIKDIKFVMNEDESYYEIITDTTQDKFGVPQVITKKYDASLYTVTVKNEGNYNEACLTALTETSEEIEDISICPIYYMIEENSFIATIIEEEPTYLIVEPNDGELEKLQSKIRKILIAGGEYRDYIYGVGRKVIITYDNKIQSDTNTIIGADIDTDGYDKFEFEVVESEKLEKKKILNNTDLNKLNTNYDLYYYGLEEVNVKVDNKVMTLENALKDGYLTMSGILSKANKDVKEVEEMYAKYEEQQSVPLILPRDIRYRDGGSVEFQYENFVIIKSSVIDNNNSMYICKAGTSLNDLNK